MWAIHLISDMAGSSSSAGKGTGIPGPVLSLFKEASVLPGVRSLSVDYKGDKIALSVWLSKLYNGTAFPHESYHDVKRLDLRTELGIYAFSVKQSIPVALNQCLIRAFYFIRHLCIEISLCKIQKLTDIRKLDPLKFLPQNNACVARMSTISTGVFSLVDISDAAIHSFLNTPENKGEFIANMLLRINFAGIAKFVVSFKKDISLSISANVKATDTTSTAAVGALTIDLEVRMENKEIYEYRFAELLNKVKHSRAHISKFAGRRNSESGPLFEIGTADYRTYDEIISHCESWTMYTIDRIITNIFEQNGIAFEPYRKAGKPVFNFVRTENGKAIYLYFLILGSWDIADTEFEKLGINHYELPVDECADPENLYLRFAEWVKPVLQLDIPKSASTVVFSIVAFVDRPIEILLQAEGEFVNSKGKLVNGQLFSTSYLNNNFEIRSSGAWDDVENTILSMIDRVISDERIDFNKMRSFPEIKVVNMLDVLKHYRKGKDY